MVGEICREAAVLIAVLAPMETIIIGAIFGTAMKISARRELRREREQSTTNR